MLQRQIRILLFVTLLAAFGTVASAQTNLTYNMGGNGGAVLGIDLRENGGCEVRSTDGNVIFTGRMGPMLPSGALFYGTYAGLDVILAVYKGPGGFDRWEVLLDGNPPQSVSQGPLTPL
jgi:hypothetical protein